MVPADGIEVDKIDYMVWVPLSSKKPLSHNGFEFNCLAEARFDPGYLDRTEIAGGVEESMRQRPNACRDRVPVAARFPTIGSFCNR
jgi:hypothetical protein